jgi:hypothetical protein
VPDPTAADDAARPSLLRWRWVLLAWLLPAIIGTLQSAAGYATRNALAQEWPYALLQFPRWMIWALVTPLVFAAHRRYPLKRPALGRSLRMHALFSVAISLAIEGLFLPVTLWISATMNPGASEPIPILGLVVFSLLGRILPGALTYAAIVGVAATLESREALRARELTASKLEAQLLQSQLGALKMQVHPHFLFNTLHAITVLIARDPAAATKMVARLGDLLRLTMSRAQAQEVSMERELELVRLYLEIEQVRFADRLTVTWDVPHGVQQAAVPDLLLQPLVENAIKHGVSRSAAPGEVVIAARREGAWLAIEVRNTGATPAGGANVTDGIGLAVTRARLEGLYVTSHEFDVDVKATGGAVARVRIPWRDAAAGGGAQAAWP